MSEDIQVFTLQEVADILKVTRQTVYNLKKKGKLKTVKIGNEYRVTKAQLQEFLDSYTS